MLSRPTTEQILLDCRNELLTTIDGALTDPAAKIAVQMMENVLRNCAARSGHEIAWMHEEIAEIVDYTAQVAASAGSTPAVVAASQRYTDERSGSLHLDDVCHDYDLAGESLSVALEAALAADDAALVEAGRALLGRRLAHELEIMGEWTMVGRG